MSSHQYQSLLFPQRFWVVNPNLTRRFHQVLRGIALYEGRYYVCCPTTTGWCPIVVSRQVRGHLWSSPLALHSLEHAVIYHVPNQLSSTVDTHRPRNAQRDSNKQAVRGTLQTKEGKVW